LIVSGSFPSSARPFLGDLGPLPRRQSCGAGLPAPTPELGGGALSAVQLFLFLAGRIERFFNKIKHFRRIDTRYEKRAANFLPMLKLASAHLWLRHMRRLF
jgi:hypothetical protein